MALSAERIGSSESAAQVKAGTQLTGRKFIVTGAGRGIGCAVADAFLAEGAMVTKMDIRFSNDVQPETDFSSSVLCDISSRAGVESAFAEAVDRMAGLDGLVNVAGIMGRLAAEAIDDDSWNAMMDVNVRGTFLTNQAAFRYLKDRGGRIVNFGSDAGLIPSPTSAHYSASKGAVIAWTRSIAHEWGMYGITVNCVLPAIWTPMYEEQRSRLNPAELEAHDLRMATTIPIGGRLGDPIRDLAPVLIFLVSEASHFVTGQLMSVSGGLGMTR
jgi:NAD(P)-dependent dehydrogenase (short-subunit alcohol dehydrogenase family)